MQIIRPAAGAVNEQVLLVHIHRDWHGRGDVVAAREAFDIAYGYPTPGQMTFGEILEAENRNGGRERETGK